ncbi:MAG: adenylosuccinate lyase [Fimbriimonadia bacterium]|jgi:adenylosuccinate lyase
MIERYQTPEMRDIWSDEARAATWLRVEIAVCRALSATGVIPPEDFEAIVSGARFDLRRMAELEQVTRHDLMAFVRNVEENIGPAGRWVHYGVTSYDIIDTALALQLTQSLDILFAEAGELKGVIGEIATRHRDTPMMGRTHGVHAEPITFGFKLAGWYAEVSRWEQRLRAAREEVAVGKVSGAVGVHGVLDPGIEAAVCAELGLRPDPASTQIVSRDRHAFVLGCLAGLGATIERFATELRNLQRTEIREVQEGFAKGQTGSSAMPHKRNPWNSETLCGLARVLRGNALAMMESVATWHERDLSNSSAERIVFPDSFHLAHFMLRKLTSILRGLRVDEERMATNLRLMRDLPMSEHVLLALVRAGLSREEAYAAVQRAAARAWAGEDFAAALQDDPVVSSRLYDEQLAECLSLEHHLRNVRHTLRAVGLDAD